MVLFLRSSNDPKQVKISTIAAEKKLSMIRGKDAVSLICIIHLGISIVLYIIWKT